MQIFGSCRNMPNEIFYEEEACTKACACDPIYFTTLAVFFSDLVVYWIVYVQKAPLSSAALVLWISLFFPIYAHCWYEHFGTDSITYSIFQSESSCCRTVLLYDGVMWQHRKFMGNRLRLLPIRTCVPFNRFDWLNLLLNRRRWVLHAVTKYL